jgi:hypothetical protein
MKFCTPHWDQLKEAIRIRGLMHLVASSGEAAFERTVAELKGEETTANYDPLMTATYMIYGRAIDCGGLYLLAGDFCPLCELDKNARNADGSIPQPLAATQWIEGCTDAVRDECVSKGLRPFPIARN